jgi:hypothetical protein
VSYVAGSYARWDFDSFCDGCALSDTIVSLNPAYLTLIKTYKSETNFLYSLTPKVLPGVVAGIKAVFSALAVSHAVSMPHIAAAAAADTTGAALTQLAIQQWADLSILGGASIVDLPLPTSTLASFPVAPELGKYLRAATNNSMTGFALPEASAVLKFLTKYDPSGIGVLGFLSVNATVGAGMVNSYASTINLTATVTGTHVRVVFPKSRHTVCPYSTDTFFYLSGNRAERRVIRSSKLFRPVAFAKAVENNTSRPDIRTLRHGVPDVPRAGEHDEIVGSALFAVALVSISHLPHSAD